MEFDCVCAVFAVSDGQTVVSMSNAASVNMLAIVVFCATLLIFERTASTVTVDVTCMSPHTNTIYVKLLTAVR